MLSPRAAVALVVFMLPPACVHTRSDPSLGLIYDRAAGDHLGHRNPVIVIPGILGSRLEQEGTRRVVWGAFAGGYANPQRADGARLLALPMDPDRPLRALTDDVQPAGVLDRVRVDVAGLPLELDAYVGILSTLGVGGFRDETLGEAGAVDYGADHYTCFQFDYDWRRDIVETAARLDVFIREKRAYVQQEIEHRGGPANAPVKFDLVGHSMGGLVARYYLRYGGGDLPDGGELPVPTWEGAKFVDRAILVGTPSGGSIKALVQLVEGTRPAPFLPRYEPVVLGTMPSIYQLLPRGRHGVLRVPGRMGPPVSDLCQPALWVEQGWGLAASDQDRVLGMLLPEVADPAERRRIALNHQAKCLRRAARLHEALDQPASPPDGLSIHLFAGDAELTDAVAAVHRGRLQIVEQWPGDGTVTRQSALMDERVGGAWRPRLVSPVRWTSVDFVFSDHLGMTSDPAFTDELLYLLLEEPRP